MNKNPFATPAYAAQPPLPPGPPPPQPTQPDYSAYWAAAAAQQQAGAANAYAANGTPVAAAAAAARPADQSQCMQTTVTARTGNINSTSGRNPNSSTTNPPSCGATSSSPPQQQPQYSPYQPQAGAYQQPYPAPPQPYQPQPYLPQQQQQQRQNNRPFNAHMGSPQQFPPAKRQRFDGPNQQHRGPVPPPPQFQPPPPPPMQQQGMFNAGPPMGGRGSFNNNSGRGGRGGPMNNRGTTRGGRGGSGSSSSYNNNMGGRGGPTRGGFQRNTQRGGYQQHQNYQQNYPQQSNYHHQNQNQNYSTSRGRGQGYQHSTRGGRHESGALGGHNSFSASSSFTSGGGKKDENKRTLTDFKIVGLKIPELSWTWEPAVKEEAKPVETPAVAPSTEGTAPAIADGSSIGTDAAVVVASAPALPPAPASDESTVKAELEALIPPPPSSRVRMYFHTPASYAAALPNARKGKRKKLEDDDGDYEDGRGAPPPPPGMDGSDYDGAGRDSVAPSVAETASDGDWLMAAIGEEEGEGGENLHVSEVENFVQHGDADGDYGNEYAQGDGDHAMGDEDAQGSDVGPDDEHYQSFPPEGVHDSPENPPLVNGHGHAADVPSGSQQPLEGIAVPAVSQADSNETSQEPISSAPLPSQEIPQPLDAPSSAPPEACSESAAPAAADSTAAPHPLQATETRRDSAYTPTVFDGEHLQDEGFEATQPVDQYSADPAEGTPTTATLLGEKVPSANRLSVSYAGATRRLVIDAEAVPNLKVFRTEGRIEVTVSLAVDERGGFKGIAMEGCSEESTYVSLELSEQLESDTTVPPLWKASIPSEVTLVLYLDKEKPLSEPRWVKTGDVQEWLRSMFGRMFWVAGDAADGWEKKAEVVDPDPAPTIFTVLESWAANSNVGQPTERQRFLRTHMVETDNILEILLRLVRGERSSFTQNAPIAPPSVSGALLSALEPGSAHGAQQTHVSLAVLAIFRLSSSTRRRRRGQGQERGRGACGEIIRSLPSHLIYKSLDGIFKEWRVEKKGGRVTQ
ncbi:uncharacterized protein BXZ73DRAFT_91760 [Epithele typhae]|uniref:uncharacterized protein n=1 Tax=Epithele typhae TaxID=378194 RepID=UPI002008422E|nr:uncharacterized protein BXZ73DRAFT_91760 [Epithele typhae]KAH9921476.1 hypothetical protein BXZ73DRAFT_91760 [Epithele typhae]